ncbi:IscS subfamily cysteine desulfurase [Jeotgalibacillus sp. ET6]|uniref:IscS subfamily cysteine desulfurase n=1 Tax=Jeotgalibacillus sp. ET6 TaxID=3037260 RepID=UPI002418B25C|nr:IscS subfamily cysteine desulfurase [Jeotgalibacillus sp. ET6]MDG5473575.1 IscS subfamily cysteine desulfurase [Jeotgalibacillus sp. ET6]
MIYLDYAASAPMRREALDAYYKAATTFPGNPSSLHDTGTAAHDLLQECRKQLADVLGGDPNGIYFTSGGSESNDLAIRSIVRGNSHRGRHIITSKLEHPSVLGAFAVLEEEGFKITYLPVKPNGLLSLQDIEKALTNETILVAIQHVNHEIGTTQQVQEIGSLLKKNSIAFHCDAVQSFGKIPIQVQENYISSLSISSHKVGGPQGVGAVYIDPSVHWKSTYRFATHQKGFRPGTLNVPGIAAFTTAAACAINEMMEHHEKTRVLRDMWIDMIKSHDEAIKIEGINQLPSIIGMTSSSFQGQWLLLECNRQQLAISVGSACHIGQQIPATTITAIGKTIDEANRFIRISLGAETSRTDLEHLYQALTPYLKIDKAI